jgi:hypothetical protein
MKSMATLGLVFGSLVVATAAYGGHKRHGTACQPQWGSASKIGFEERGVGNYDATTSATVFCPTQDVEGRHWTYTDPQGSDAAPSFVAVWVVDNSTTQPAYCYIWATNENTDSSWGPTRHTCSSADGCDGTTGGESATGYRRILFHDNVVDQPIYQDPDDFGENYYDAFGVRCTLPPGSSSATRSFVKLVDTSYSSTVSPF